MYLPYPEWLSPQVAPGLPLRWYGIMYLVAFVVTFALFRYEARRSRLCTDRDEISRFFTWVIVSALLGGRLFYVFVFADVGEFLQKPWTIVWPFDEGRFTGIQGMSYHGGFLGAVVGVVGFALQRRHNVLEWGDTLAVSAPLGYTFGRIGNFINGELLGRITTARWGMVFPAGQRSSVAEPWVVEIASTVGMEIAPGASLVNLPRHASQLYEGFMEGLVLWLVLWLVFRTRRMFRGALIGLYTFGYGVARFLVEYFRQTNEDVGFVMTLGRSSAAVELTDSLLHLTEGQSFSLVMAMTGLALVMLFRFVHRPDPIVQTFADRPDQPPSPGR